MDLRTTYGTTTTTGTFTMDSLPENCRWKTRTFNNEALDLITELIDLIDITSKTTTTTTTDESLETVKLLRTRRADERVSVTSLDTTLTDTKLLLRKITVLYNGIVGTLDECDYIDYTTNLELMDYRIISRIAYLRNP